MLGKSDAIAVVAVKDLDTARKFYEDTLGLTPVGTQGEELVTFRSGDSMINLYRSKYAGTNQATAIAWAVGEQFDDIVPALRAKGVTFEHYDVPGMTREGDVHAVDMAGGFRTVWFKDSDGNILNLANQ